MIHKIIFLNGPPGSGKDQAGIILKRTHGARTYKMSHPMKEALAALFYIDPFQMKEEIEPTKDQRTFDMFECGRDRKIMTWREVQISFAETWARPVFGYDIFGRLAVEYLKQLTSFDMTVITDTGFREETIPIIRHVGHDNCLLIQLMRDECTFEGDSRSYIDVAGFGVTTVELHNRYPLNPTAEMPLTYEMQLVSVVNGWLGIDDGD